VGFVWSPAAGKSVFKGRWTLWVCSRRSLGLSDGAQKIISQIVTGRITRLGGWGGGGGRGGGQRVAAGRPAIVFLSFAQGLGRPHLQAPDNQTATTNLSNLAGVQRGPSACLKPGFKT